MKDAPCHLLLSAVACLILLGCASERQDSEESPPSADAPTPDVPGVAEPGPDGSPSASVPEPYDNAPVGDGSSVPAAVTRVPPEVAMPEAMTPDSLPQETAEPALPDRPTDRLPTRSTASMPLEVPTLLSPDGAAPLPLTLRNFNPIRDEGSGLGTGGQPDGMKLETSFSASTPKVAMALPMVEAPKLAPGAESTAPLPGAAFSTPGLSLHGGSVPEEAVIVLQPNTAEPVAAAPAISPGLPGPDAPTSLDAPAATDPPAAAQTMTPSDRAEPATPASEPESADAYTVVRVFYGTDRNAVANSVLKPSLPLGWVTSTAFVALTTLLLGVAALRSRRNPALRWSALGSLACTFLLAGATMAVKLQSEPSIGAECTENPAASTAKMAYGNQRGELEYGVCEVSIPKIHRVGQLEAPSIFRLDFRETPERHVILAGIEPLESQAFFEGLKTRVDESAAKSAFVFVHGFNVTFEDAARRTAQIAYDLKFDGAPIFFSWPSQGGLFKYTIDETNVMWTVPHLRQFLTEVAERTEARRIHLVAHSMGNRALTSALRDLSFLPDDKRPRFSEVVLTAPDIDAEVFRKDIAPYIVQTADRVTLYASSNDTALAYSKTVHGYPRAGDSGQELLVLPGMETVDVSEVDTSLLGHNYYGNNETVLADLIEVLQRSMPPQQRRWLRSAQVGPLEYWVFQR